MTAQRLSLRAINRATLARQLLLERSALAPIAAVEHLVGLQSQTPQTWYTGLWSRLVDFDPSAFGELLETRQVVRLSMMRSTIHLVSARDAIALRPLVQSVGERGALSAYGKYWAGLDLDAVAAAARSLLEKAPLERAPLENRGLTFAELGALLKLEWPERDGPALAQAARTLLALVQTPPRGVWGKSGQSRHTTIESWLGRDLDGAGSGGATSVDTMVLRYLGAFGPASVRDIQAWSGLTRLAEVVDRLRPQLRLFLDGNGRELFDLPGSPRPAEDHPAPIRFLYDFDNILLSHADRSRVLSEDAGVLGAVKDLAVKNGVLPSFLLIDGFVGATWSLARERRTASLTIRLFAPIDGTRRHELEREAAALLVFWAPDAETTEVRIEAPHTGEYDTPSPMRHR
jgi:Winged helix DNA-binding domain